MAETLTPTSPVDALGASNVKPLAGDAKHTALDGQVSKILGATYSVQSARYYHVSADIPWVAISKNVQNQMLEKSIQKGHYAGEDPGIVFIDLYPQPEGAFAVAMDSATASKGEKLVGYYVLKAK